MINYKYMLLTLALMSTISSHMKQLITTHHNCCLKMIIMSPFDQLGSYNKGNLEHFQSNFYFQRQLISHQLAVF